MITRFAPSPTGKIHVGNARTALLCFLYARKQGGKFLLRIDDTDFNRYDPTCLGDLEVCFKWMGIKYDSCFKQSDRSSRYKEVFNQLRSLGLIYPCYEKAEEIELKRKLQLKRGKPPVYDRASLHLKEDQLDKHKKEGRVPHFRFKLDQNELIAWEDLIRGRIAVKLDSLSDPVVVRSDESYTYMLPSVVDDMDYNITHVIRGADHITNTAVQIAIMKALNFSDLINFAHISLLHTKLGKLSKRDNAITVTDVHNMDIEAMVFNSYLSKVGTSRAIETVDCLDSLITDFDITAFSASEAIFDVAVLNSMNSKFAKKLSFDQVSDRLPGTDECFWESIKHNINTVSEVSKWWSICEEVVDPICTDLELLKVAALLLENEEWDEGVWNRWIRKIKEKTGLSGNSLFMPIRLALTASEEGPELAKIFYLISKDKVMNRLNGKKS